MIALASTLAAPHFAFSQEKIRRVAWFGAGRAGAPSPFFAALQAGFRELNWQEGRNIAIEDRWAEGRTERYAAIAAELVRLKADVIYGGNAAPVLK